MTITIFRSRESSASTTVASTTLWGLKVQSLPRIFRYRESSATADAVVHQTLHRYRECLATAIAGIFFYRRRMKLILAFRKECAHLVGPSGHSLPLCSTFLAGCTLDTSIASFPKLPFRIRAPLVSGDTLLLWYEDSEPRPPQKHQQALAFQRSRRT